MNNDRFSSWLRSQPTLAGSPPILSIKELPDTPIDLMIEWLSTAIQAGVPEAHAMTLATVDKHGFPDARTLILKDVSPVGWSFAGLRTSTKGDQLQSSPRAALNFWWQPIVRAVRIRGYVREASRADCDADLAARSESARASVEPGGWVLWRLVPEHVEFWQGSPDRNHTRIMYERAGDSWARSISGAQP